MKTLKSLIAISALTVATVLAAPTIAELSKSRIVPPDPVTLVPPPASTQPLVELVFVLDATGSMGPMIETAKEKIWSIASTVANSKPAPILKVGLVAYRDQSDAQRLEISGLTSDLDLIFSRLNGLQAMGGGDTPEDVIGGLNAALYEAGWSNQQQSRMRTIFLVGDAPAHAARNGQPALVDLLEEAKQRKIQVNTLQYGANPQTAQQWVQIAQMSGGQHLDVQYSIDAVALATPYDDKLAALAEELDRTRVLFGEREEVARKQAANAIVHESASASNKARRARYATTEAGRNSMFESNDLVSSYAKDKEIVAAVPKSDLPAALQDMDESELMRQLSEKQQKREQLMEEIRTVSEQRAGYLRKSKPEATDGTVSFDDQIHEALESQAADVGLALPEDPDV